MQVIAAVLSCKVYKLYCACLGWGETGSPMGGRRPVNSSSCKAQML